MIGRVWLTDGVVPPLALGNATDAELIAEFDRRFSRLCDTRPRTCPQLCPRCSSTNEEVFGTWDRDTWRFECECGLVRTGDRYERALEDFYASSWRAKREQAVIQSLLREARK